MTEPSEATPRNLSLQVGGFDLMAREYGPADGSPVLALHGWMDHADSFAPLAPHLAGCRVVALDLPGHGLTEMGGKGHWFHYIDNVPLVFQTLTVLGWDRCHLIGHSMGGGLGALLAATFPERFASFVSIDMLGPISGPENHVVQQLRKGVLDRSGGLKQRYFATYDEALAARENEHFPLALCRVLGERGIVETDRGYTWLGDRRLKWSSLQRYTEAQVREILAAIECPVLVLLAEQHRYPQMVQLLKKREGICPQETVITAPGGHHLHMEHPQICAEHILAFYAGLEESGSIAEEANLS
ncbi:MAG: alpha/beta hydrolase [Pseudomonadota bacterium]